MDPIATINLINECIADQGFSEARNSCFDLLDWIYKGGVCEKDGQTTEFWRQWALNISGLCFAYIEHYY